MALKDSPNDQTAAPKSTMSFNRNCPGAGDKNGNPRPSCKTGGVENKKLSVSRKVIAAIALPIADARADQGRAAISTALVTSITPMTLEAAWTLNTLYIQLMNGLFCTKG